MGGRLFDWLGAGLAADRPTAAATVTNTQPNSAALYYNTDSNILSVLNPSTPAWLDIDVGALAALTTESIQDMIAAFVAAGTGLTLTYNDAGNLLTLDCTITQYTDEMAQDAIAAMIAAGSHTGITVTYDDVSNTLSFTNTVTQYTNEMAMDAIAAMLAAGSHTGITVGYNDAGDAMSLTVTITQYTDEMVDDRVAALIADDGGITKTYDDAGNLLKIRASRFLIPFFFVGAPTADEVLGIYAATDAFTLPANLSTTKGTVGTAPAADYVITISRRVNNAGAYASIATITIHNDGTYTLATAGGVDIAIAVNDILKITAQHTVDASIANTAFTIRGN